MALQPRTITYNGRTQTYTEWAAELGLTPQAIRYRIDNGWSIKDTLTRRASVRGDVQHDKANDQSTRYQRMRAAELRAIDREFRTLVAKMNDALTTFNARLSELADIRPGVGQSPSENAPDRSPPVAQDSL